MYTMHAIRTLNRLCFTVLLWKKTNKAWGNALLITAIPVDLVSKICGQTQTFEAPQAGQASAAEATQLQATQASQATQWGQAVRGSQVPRVAQARKAKKNKQSKQRSWSTHKKSKDVDSTVHYITPYTTYPPSYFTKLVKYFLQCTCI